MIKAVIFDLDDTLISEKEYVLSGFHIVSEVISNRYNLYKAEVYKNMIRVFEEDSKNVFNRVLELFSIVYSKNEIIDLIKIYRNHEPNIKFFDDVIPTIKELKQNKIKVGIITDGYKEAQLRKIEVLKCREIFDEIIITDELGRAFWKPHQKSYKLMSNKLNVKFKEMIYVGDNVKKDFKGANDLGILTLKIEREEGIYKCIEVDDQYSPKYIIDNIRDVNRFINKMVIKSEGRSINEEGFICNYS